MGLFKAVGRRVERFKQTAQETADENAEYRCRTCDVALQTDHDRCPECGAKTVTARNATD